MKTNYTSEYEKHIQFSCELNHLIIRRNLLFKKEYRHCILHLYAFFF